MTRRDEKVGIKHSRAKYRTPRSRLAVLVAIAVALSVGGGLLLAMRSMFRVGEDMVKSVDESRSLPKRSRRSEPQVRSRDAVDASASAPIAPAVRAPGVLRGTIEFPPNTPADEEAAVALVHERDARLVHVRAPLAKDGAFELTVPEGVDVARLALVARYAYLANCIHVDLRARTEPLLLEARLGARITGRIVVPPERAGFAMAILSAGVELVSAAPHAPRHVRIAARASELPGDAAEDVLAPRFARVGEDGAFELGGIPPGERYGLDACDLLSAPADFALAAGETRDVRLELVDVVELSGLVRDESGTPLAGARVWFDVESVLQPLGGETTGLDGRFALLARRGSTRAQWIASISRADDAFYASLDGFERTRVSIGRTLCEVDRDDLVAVLRRSGDPAERAPLRGRVTWTDGAPAAEAWVAVQSLAAREITVQDVGRFETPRVVLTDEDGAFEVSAPVGRARVLAFCREFAPQSADDAEVDADEVARTGCATAEIVVARDALVDGALVDGMAAENAERTPPVELVLARGRGVRGVVVDENGAPRGGAVVSARPKLGFELDDVPSLQRLRTSATCAPDGRFELAELVACEWLVEATDGVRRSAASAVQLANGDAFVTITLSARPTLAGRIRPFVEAEGESHIDVISASEGRGDDGPRTFAAQLGPDGAFHVDHLEPGTYAIVATRKRTLRPDGTPIRVSKGFTLPPPAVITDPRTFVVEPGSHLELELTPARASVHGALVDARGRALAATEVELRLALGDTGWEQPIWPALRVEGGTFAIDGLPAGDYVLVWSGVAAGAPCSGASSFTLASGESREVSLTNVR